MEMPIDDAPTYEQLSGDCIAMALCIEKIRAALEEAAPSASPNIARDEICSWCANDEALARIVGGGRFNFCPMCGRKLSPVA